MLLRYLDVLIIRTYFGFWVSFLGLLRLINPWHQEMFLQRYFWYVRIIWHQIKLIKSFLIQVLFLEKMKRNWEGNKRLSRFRVWLSYLRRKKGRLFLMILLWLCIEKAILKSLLKGQIHINFYRKIIR